MPLSVVSHLFVVYLVTMYLGRIEQVIIFNVTFERHKYLVLGFLRLKN